MNRTAGGWQRVQAALDRRADPLDDPAIVAWLGSDAAALEEFARLHERLQLVAGPVCTPRRVGVRRRLLASCAAAAAVLAIAWSWFANGGATDIAVAPPREPQVRQQAAATPAPRPESAVVWLEETYVAAGGTAKTTAHTGQRSSWLQCAAGDVAAPGPVRWLRIEHEVIDAAADPAPCATAGR